MFPYQNVFSKSNWDGDLRFQVSVSVTERWGIGLNGTFRKRSLWNVSMQIFMEGTTLTAQEARRK